MARRLVVRLPSRNVARLSSESCTAFQSMPRGNVEVSVPDSFHGAAARCPPAEQERRASFVRILYGISVNAAGGTLKLAFRLFPWRGGSLSAYRADNNAAAPRKFARKLAARPTYSAQHRREIERFRPYCFPDSGGLGLRQTLLGIFRACSAPFRWIGTSTCPTIDHRVRSRWALPKPAKEP